MKLIIELDVDTSYLSEEEAESFRAFAELDATTGINVELGGPHETIQDASQMMSLGTEYFKVRIEE